jgi:hypothetical protein
MKRPRVYATQPANIFAAAGRDPRGARQAHLYSLHLIVRSPFCYRTFLLLLSVFLNFLHNLPVNCRSSYEQSANPVMPESVVRKHLGGVCVDVEIMNVEAVILL